MSIYTQIDGLRAARDDAEHQYWMAVDAADDWYREAQYDGVAWAGYEEAVDRVDRLGRVIVWRNAKLARLLEREDALGRARDLIEWSDRDRFEAAYERELDAQFGAYYDFMPPVEAPVEYGQQS